MLKIQLNTIIPLRPLPVCRWTSAISGCCSGSFLWPSWRSTTCSTVPVEGRWRAWLCSPGPGSPSSPWPRVRTTAPPLRHARICSCPPGGQKGKRFSGVYDVLFFKFHSLCLVFFTEEFKFILDLETKEPIWEFGPDLSPINVCSYWKLIFFVMKILHWTCFL